MSWKNKIKQFNQVYVSLSCSSCLQIISYGTSTVYKVERDKRYLRTLYRVRSLTLQPLAAGNSVDISQAFYSNTKKHNVRAMNLTSLDFLGSWESIYVYLYRIMAAKK